MARIEYIEFRDYTSDIVDVIRSSFNVFNTIKLSKDYMDSIAKIDEDVSRGGFYALYIDDKPVSVVQIIYRTFCLKDVEIGVAGIANVATHPEHRGRGYASKLFNHLLSDLMEKGVALTALFTGYGSGAHRIYRRNRFTDIAIYSNRVCVLDDIERIYKLYGGHSYIQDAKPDKLKEIYGSVLNRLAGFTVKRSGRRWRELLSMKQYATWFLGYGDSVYIDIGRGRGYALTYYCSRSVLAPLCDAKTAIVLELLANGRKALEYTIGAVFETLYLSGIRTIKLRLPKPFNCVLKYCGEVGTDEVFMARVVDREVFIDKLSSILFRRGFSGRDVFTIEVDGRKYVVNYRRDTIEPSSSIEGGILVTEKALLRLILGSTSARQEYLLGNIELDVSGKARVLNMLNRVLRLGGTHYISLIDKW